jgi:hypothetical protein
MPYPALPTQVQCPSCGNRFNTQIRTVIDVGEQPELKEQFLQGKVNYARCPECGTGGVLSTPLVYHDPEKELLITFVPSELGLSAEEQEQFIGELVNAVMNNVPAEERKGYFLQPKMVLSMDSLYDAILEGEGVSPEMLQAQRQRIDLINRLLTNLDDNKTFDELVEKHKERLDYEFFLVLSDLIDNYRESGDEDAKVLESLRGKLLERVDLGVPPVVTEDSSHDEVIETLRQIESEQAFRRAVAVNRARLDYSFFQALTAKIESAEAADDDETVQALSELRQKILDEIQAQDNLAREAEDRASLLIMNLNEAEDLQAELREHQDELDEVFFLVLSRYIESARRQNQETRAQKLQRILDGAIELLEERLPPDARLINRLIRAEYPDETNELLEAHRGLLTDEFEEQLERYTEQLADDGQEDLAAHLEQVQGQVKAKRTILRG